MHITARSCIAYTVGLLFVVCTVSVCTFSKITCSLAKPGVVGHRGRSMPCLNTRLGDIPNPKPPSQCNLRFPGQAGAVACPRGLVKTTSATMQKRLQLQIKLLAPTGQQPLPLLLCSGPSRRCCLRAANDSIDRVFFLPAAERARAPAGGSHGARDHRELPPLHLGVARGHGRARAVPDHRRAHARLAAALSGRHQHTVRGPRADFQCSSICDVLGVHSSDWRSNPGILDDPYAYRPPDAEDGAHADPPGGAHPRHLRRVRGVQVPRCGRGAGPDEPPLVARHHRHRALRPAVAVRLRYLLAARRARGHPRRGDPGARHGRAGDLHARRVRGADGARGEERRGRLHRRDEAHQRHGDLHPPLRGRRRVRRRAAQDVLVGGGAALHCPPARVCLLGRRSAAWRAFRRIAVDVTRLVLHLYMREMVWVVCW